MHDMGHVVDIITNNKHYQLDSAIIYAFLVRF